MEGVDGYAATREVKSDAETYNSLVLLMFDEDRRERGYRSGVARCERLSLQAF